MVVSDAFIAPAKTTEIESNFSTSKRKESFIWDKESFWAFNAFILSFAVSATFGNSNAAKTPKTNKKTAILYIWIPIVFRIGFYCLILSNLGRVPSAADQ